MGLLIKMVSSLVIREEGNSSDEYRQNKPGRQQVGCPAMQPKE